ncbi:beta-mannosidase [Alsobacter soli]|uniref:Beta-mannosidase n=1 Tax=Alsobacter soli TaxID=2109933 RepID=A0A2T1HYI4_9HYPH|nr:glycoside hydrolase family 2 protein [Alsobacter soli]PSC06650.1 beta-mannosidase [Alsobacter soli]
MARWTSSADTVRAVEAWELATTGPGAAAAPSDLPLDLRWLPAAVPGTAAAALADAGAWSFERPQGLHDKDVWYRARLEGQGPETLRFEGLATTAEVWLDDRRILLSDNMFLAHEVDVELSGEHVLAIAFRAIADRVAAVRPRGRWRAPMIAGDGLRRMRTTLLGHMPGWCPPVDVVGPWRPVTRIRGGGVRIREVGLRAEALDDQGGRLRVRVDLEPSAAAPTLAALCCAGAEAPLRETAPGRLEGELNLADVDRWFPNGYGPQPLYPVGIRLGEAALDLGRVGFRSIEVDRGTDGKGFALVVNGRKVFCRGACWTPLDVVSLNAAPEECRQALEQVRDAGFTMLRVSGTTVYETDLFYALCDELGILVWQDAMLANLDHPADDPAFVSSLVAEARHFLSRNQSSPSLAVFCGGSEAAQQAAMLGAPPDCWSGPITREVLPAVVAQLRPDLAYVENSPFGGPLPFAADEGVTHYYGVGAYRRPLEDTRRAGVRFASECLAFANVPEAATLRRLLPGPVGDPLWKRRAPRDSGAAWDFEDVRDHYVALLYGVDPVALRASDPERYLDLSRAAVAEVMEATFAEWRRPGSPTAGGLVWFLRDLWPGAGWGLVDAAGRPKSAFSALRRAFRPVQLAATDEGVNGLALHLLNDTPRPVEALLSFACLREGAVPVARAERAVALSPRSALTLSSAELLGGFFDVTYAYRFGPPSHDVCVAALRDARSGAVLAEAFHFPLGRGDARQALGLSARLDRDGEGWSLVVSTDRFAQSVHVVDDAYWPEDNWFHLAPGHEKRVRLRPAPGASASPLGRVEALNGLASCPYEAEP